MPRRHELSEQLACCIGNPSELNLRELPSQSQRVESGPTQFGNDWPGVFIRGDHALPFAHGLSSLGALLGDIGQAIQTRSYGQLAGLFSRLDDTELVGLVELLKSCEVRRPA